MACSWTWDNLYSFCSTRCYAIKVIMINILELVSTCPLILFHHHGFLYSICWSNNLGSSSCNILIVSWFRSFSIVIQIWNLPHTKEILECKYLFSSGGFFLSHMLILLMVSYFSSVVTFCSYIASEVDFSPDKTQEQQAILIETRR